MDKLSFYRKSIQKILQQYEDIVAQTPDPQSLDSVLSFDTEQDHYIWMRVGWTKEQHLIGITVYIRIKNEKIYIEQDWTEEGMATELLREGVPAADIVLAFHPPEMRHLTEFAIA